MEEIVTRGQGSCIFFQVWVVRRTLKRKPEEITLVFIPKSKTYCLLPSNLFSEFSAISLLLSLFEFQYLIFQTGIQQTLDALQTYEGTELLIFKYSFEIIDTM